MNSFKRLFILFGVILFIIFLPSCFKHEHFEFQEGIYKYDGEPFLFYQDVIIEDIIIEFKESDLDYNDLEDKTNYIQNRKNKKTYEVIFSLKRQNETNYIEASFLSLPKVGDQIDRYRIDIDLTDLMKEEARAEFRLQFSNNINEGPIANEISLDLMELTINGNTKNIMPEDDPFNYSNSLYYIGGNI